MVQVMSVPFLFFHFAAVMFDADDQWVNEQLKWVWLLVPICFRLCCSMYARCWYG